MYCSHSISLFTAPHNIYIIEAGNKLSKSKSPKSTASRKHKLFECHYCGFVTDSGAVSLRKHVKEVREEIKKYHCTECGIKVSRKYHLIRHIKAVHHKEKFWRCEDCVIIRQTIKFVSKSISKPNMKLVVIVIYFTVWSHYKIFLKEWLKQIWSVSVLGVYSKVTSTVLSRSTLRLIMKGRIIIHVKNVFLLDKVWMTMPSITIHSTRLIVTHMLAQIVASSALTNMIWSDITVTHIASKGCTVWSDYRFQYHASILRKHKEK